MADQAVQAHNAARAEAQGGPRPSLTWSNDLAAKAQVWANHLASINNMQHDPNSGGGENLYASSGGASFVDGVHAWVDEKKNYHGEKIGEGNFGSYGHYTQVIWPETTQVGMAMAKGSNGWVYVVGRYSPAGNFTGKTAWRPGPNSTSPTKGSDGLMFLNGYKDGQLHTIVGWYSKLEANITSLPNAQSQTKIDRWEGSEQHVTFPDGNVLTWSIPSDAQSKPDQTKVGTAHNKQRNFDIYKDNKRKVFDLDGISYNVIYWLG
ncbi:CAP domain-containing protein [Tricladium varicosporioides]|nr:CAP domain-containing protein [Hymenoscyphus varicosporioides]